MGSNPAAGQKKYFFSQFFFLSFFNCNELVIPWGVSTKYVDPLGGGEVLFSSLMWDIAHCELFACNFGKIQLSLIEKKVLYCSLAKM